MAKIKCAKILNAKISRSTVCGILPNSGKMDGSELLSHESSDAKQWRVLEASIENCSTYSAKHLLLLLVLPNCQGHFVNFTTILPSLYKNLLWQGHPLHTLPHLSLSFWCLMSWQTLIFKKKRERVCVWVSNSERKWERESEWERTRKVDREGGRERGLFICCPSTKI